MLFDRGFRLNLLLTLWVPEYGFLRRFSLPLEIHRAVGRAFWVAPPATAEAMRRRADHDSQRPEVIFDIEFDLLWSTYFKTRLYFSPNVPQFRHMWPNVTDLWPAPPARRQHRSRNPTSTVFLRHKDTNLHLQIRTLAITRWDRPLTVAGVLSPVSVHRLW